MRTLTEQRQKKGGKLETLWLKASTGRVIDSALGPRCMKNSVTNTICHL